MLSGGLQECFLRVSKSAIRGSVAGMSGKLQISNSFSQLKVGLSTGPIPLCLPPANQRMV